MDDDTRSSVNLAVQVIIVEAMTECPGGEPWIIRTFDLHDAYRQCAVSPSSSKFSIFRMLALPFGSVKSVHSCKLSSTDDRALSW